MQETRLSPAVLLISIFAINHVLARYERVGYLSDPVGLLLQGSYPTWRDYDYAPIKRPFRQIRKRRYPTSPPSFYSNFGYDEMPTSRRQIILPYDDLLFNGR